MPRTPQVPYQAVADALRARLDSGEWLPGEQLPPARVLAEEYGGVQDYGGAGGAGAG